MSTESKDYLCLKWGTLKGWNFEGNEKAIELLKEYHNIGASMSVMTQRDTPRQKEIILELIDVCNGTIENGWDDTVYASKEDAKKYVLEYGRK